MGATTWLNCASSPGNACRRISTFEATELACTFSPKVSHEADTLECNIDIKHLLTQFTDEVSTLFEVAGLRQEQNVIDRRLQVNRGKMLKMYRVWIQTKFRKPLEEN